MSRAAILIVDDDENLLKSFRRVLSRHFDTDIADGPEAALEKLKGGADYDIVISDYRMPGMDGVSLLSAVRSMRPDSVRMLLTGYAELEVAIRAVNEGNIFRLLTKPCDPKDLAKALTDALRFRRAMRAEQELLEETLRRCVGVMSDLAALLKPDEYGRISRILPYVRGMSMVMEDPQPWETETAAMLSMIGFITLPPSIVSKVLEDQSLSAKQRGLFAEHPAMAAKFVADIPRMGPVAEVLAYQEKRYDGTGIPDDDRSGDDIPLGARILKLVVDFDILVSNGMSKDEALVKLQQRRGWYDMKAMLALDKIVGSESRYAIRSLHLLGLEPGMLLAEDIHARRGMSEVMVLSKGKELSEMNIEFLIKYGRHYEIIEPIRIMEPLCCMLGDDHD